MAPPPKNACILNPYHNHHSLSFYLQYYMRLPVFFLVIVSQLTANPFAVHAITIETRAEWMIAGIVTFPKLVDSVLLS